MFLVDGTFSGGLQLRLCRSSSHKSSHTRPQGIAKADTVPQIPADYHGLASTSESESTEIKGTWPRRQCNAEKDCKARPSPPPRHETSWNAPLRATSLQDPPRSCASDQPRQHSPPEPVRDGAPNKLEGIPGSNQASNPGREDSTKALSRTQHASLSLMSITVTCARLRENNCNSCAMSRAPPDSEQGQCAR